MRGPAAALHALEGDGLGRVRPRRSAATRSSAATGPVDRWRALRDEIHAEVCERAWSEAKQAFTQSYDSDELDASVLLMPLVGFLPATDARMVSTVEAIRRELTRGRAGPPLPAAGATRRRRPARRRGRLPAVLVLARRRARAPGPRTTRRASCSSGCSTCATTSACSRRSTTRVASRQLGNFPQAFTHLALVNTALVLSSGRSVRDTD